MQRTITSFLCASMLVLTGWVQGQSLLNGGFEQGNANTCLYNLVNGQFNFAVQNVQSFGNTPNAGSFGEADVLVGGCLAGPYSGQRAVMVACEATTTDRLAFTLDQPMQAGVPYRLSLMAYAWTQFNPVVHALEVGVSTSATSFGTAVGTVNPQAMTWNAHEVHFTLAQNASFLTLQVVLDGVNGAVIIDDLVLESTASVADEVAAAAPFLRGTVVGETLEYMGEMPGELSVLDHAGRMVRRFRVGGPASLPVADLPAGGYLVSLELNGQRRVTRIVKP